MCLTSTRTVSRGKERRPTITSPLGHPNTAVTASEHWVGWITLWIILVFSKLLFFIFLWMPYVHNNSLVPLPSVLCVNHIVNPDNTALAINSILLCLKILKKQC